MKCTNPITLYFDSEGTRIPKSDYDRLLLSGAKVYCMHAPCGKCLACRINKRREWTLRLCHEEVFSDTAYFVTLTYDEEHVPLAGDYLAVYKPDIQLFMKRLRKDVAKMDPDIKIRFFLNSEYGPETSRPHYHMLLFNVPSEKMFEGARMIKRSRKSVSFTCPYLMEIWRNGNVEFGIASKERAGYCAKYFIDRKEVDPNLQPNFSLMSRRPGIGFAYQEKIADKVQKYGLKACLNSSGTYVALPRYYREKIYTEEQRHEQLMERLGEVPDQEYWTMLENADLVEQNRYRALHWKGKKSKL